jgi:GNAT superfamily N-acetyltransferase
MSSAALAEPSARIVVRPMRESDLPAARSIVRLAFGTFLGVPNPEDFWPDREYVGTRWRADPTSAFSAEIDGTLVGSNFAAHWGSVAFFGPLTIRPSSWNQGIAQHLLAATMDLFEKWGVRDAGLFTFAHSTRHVHLYQKFGFWPRFLTAILSKSVGGPKVLAPTVYSSVNHSQRSQVLDACRALTDSIYGGLDVTSEIRSVQDQALGETLVIWDGDSLDAFAVCHCGEGTEAGAGACYIKFAAVKPGSKAEKTFERLLDACEALASARGLQRVVAGANLNRSRAYRALLARGYRADAQGVAMHRPDSPAYNRPDVFIVDDWR